MPTDPVLDRMRDLYRLLAAAWHAVVRLAPRSRAVPLAPSRPRPPVDLAEENRGDLVRRLAERLEARPLCFLVGPSGSGKSTVLSVLARRGIGLHFNLADLPAGYGGKPALAVVAERITGHAVQGREAVDAARAALRSKRSTGSTATLLLDQIEDYSPRVSPLVSSEDQLVVSPERMIKQDALWRFMQTVLRAGEARCLVAIRSDTPREPLALAPNLVQILPPLEPNDATRCLDEAISVAAGTDAALVEKIALLKHEIVADLDHDSGGVLAVEMTLAVQGLFSLPEPSLAAYNDAGRLGGLIRHSIRRVIARTAAAHHLSPEAVLRALVEAYSDAGSGAASIPDDAMESLAEVWLVRRGGPARAWGRYHDFLVAPIRRIAEEHTRPTVELVRGMEAASRARGVASWWAALLPRRNWWPILKSLPRQGCGGQAWTRVAWYLAGSIFKSFWRATAVAGLFAWFALSMARAAEADRIFGAFDQDPVLSGAERRALFELSAATDSVARAVTQRFFVSGPNLDRLIAHGEHIGRALGARGPTVMTWSLEQWCREPHKWPEQERRRRAHACSLLLQSSPVGSTLGMDSLITMLSAGFLRDLPLLEILGRVDAAEIPDVATVLAAGNWGTPRERAEMVLARWWELGQERQALVRSRLARYLALDPDRSGLAQAVALAGHPGGPLREFRDAAVAACRLHLSSLSPPQSVYSLATTVKDCEAILEPSELEKFAKAVLALAERERSTPQYWAMLTQLAKVDYRVDDAQLWRALERLQGPSAWGATTEAVGLLVRTALGQDLERAIEALRRTPLSATFSDSTVDGLLEGVPAESLEKVCARSAGEEFSGYVLEIAAVRRAARESVNACELLRDKMARQLLRGKIALGADFATVWRLVWPGVLPRHRDAFERTVLRTVLLEPGADARRRDGLVRLGNAVRSDRTESDRVARARAILDEWDPRCYLLGVLMPRLAPAPYLRAAATSAACTNADLDLIVRALPVCAPESAALRDQWLAAPALLACAERLEAGRRPIASSTQ